MILEKRQTSRNQNTPRLEDTFNRVIDRRLPEWARRSNPIVRRSLGASWKLLAPDLGVIGRLYAMMAGIILVSALLPGILLLLMPTVTITLVLLPVGAILYAQALYGIGAAAAENMTREKRGETLALLLIIPRPLMQILYSKVAAAVWRQMENLNLILVGVVLFSLPLLIIQYDIYFTMDEQPVLVYGGMIAALGVSLVRVLIEPVMVASLGVLSGTAAWGRIPAIITTMLLTGAYFALINLARLLPLDNAGRILVELVLPIVMPLIIIFVALRLTTFLLTRD